MIRATGFLPEVSRQLVGGVPSRVSALDHVHDPASVNPAHVVVHGEQIAELVEREVLWIAKADVEQFQSRPVGKAAKHRSTARCGEWLPFGGPEVESAVADAEIDSAIRSRDQPVKIMAVDADPDAQPGVQRTPFVGLIRGHAPERGGVRYEECVPQRQDARGVAFERAVEAGEDFGVIRPAIPVPVEQATENVRIPRQFRRGHDVSPAGIHGRAVFEGVSGVVLHRPPSRHGHAPGSRDPAIRLDRVQTARGVEADGDGVADMV